MDTPTRNATNIDRLARRRARAKMGFYTHAFVYSVVITGLTVLSFGRGQLWSLWPAAGWGLGLLMHCLSAFWIGPGSSLEARLVERERQRLAAWSGNEGTLQ